MKRLISSNALATEVLFYTKARAHILSIDRHNLDLHCIYYYSNMVRCKSNATRDRWICAIHRLRCAIDGSINCASIDRSCNDRSIDRALLRLRDRSTDGNGRLYDRSIDTQLMDPSMAQSNRWIAQIHRSRVAFDLHRTIFE